MTGTTSTMEAGACADEVAPGWRWLDLRKLCELLISQRKEWVNHGAFLERVVYCTAFIDGKINKVGRRDQDSYVNALRANGSFDHLELGRYTSRVKTALLATKGTDGKPLVTRAKPPVVIQDSAGNHIKDARFMVSYHLEE